MNIINGNFSDPIFEQDLLRLLKSVRYLTWKAHNRHQPLPATYQYATIWQKCLGSTQSSTQLKDMQPSSRTQNAEHLDCFANCFCAHIFAYDESNGLFCLKNGVADEPFVNYEDAFSIGKAAADAISRKDLSLHRNNHVITIMSAKT